MRQGFVVVGPPNYKDTHIATGNHSLITGGTVDLFVSPFGSNYC